ncbi:hydroxyacylglutathione hydrolase [Neptunicella marina]|uniref:Hydroxyacylglutathione hydrolase n=1 Tax=Neptunicella marina TaxID=2125989 RepID=A0A8J6IND2_9ALTE|nr:hydroxyacylglutathione hydrolase [Neptunicella marina]MBC3764476.1 hydroxyacylglutathione hydrolase [Neptunicella marina]
MNLNNFNVTPIEAFSDNYIWCIELDKHCIVVDPGDSAPVLTHLNTHNLTPVALLITHHHADHIGGVKTLVEKYPDIQVIAGDNSRIPCVTQLVKQGQSVDIEQLNLRFEVLSVPGHTRDHFAFYSDLGLFCGDTLFSAGCGRLFEGTPDQMLDSLKKLSELPASTPVYCTHEYTLSNIRFALAAEPNNQQLQAYQQHCQNLRAAQKPTLPSSIGQELAINPFLRCTEQEIINNVKQHSQQPLSSENDVFAALRSWKDNF